MKKLFKNDKLKWWLTLGSIVLLAVMVISLCVTLGRTQTTTTLNNGAYHIGSIDTTTGAIVDSKQNIYSDMFTTKDLTIEVEENAQITYKVVFYNENNDFVSATDSQSANFVNTNIPSTATQFRVVITPNLVDGENVRVNIFNMAKYTGMLKISVAR